MTESESSTPREISPHCSPAAAARRKRRKMKERLFRSLGIGAIFVGLSFLVLLFWGIVQNGHGAFQQTFIKLDVQMSGESLGIDRVDESSLSEANFAAPIRAALYESFPHVKTRHDKRRLVRLVSSGAAFQLREALASYPGLLGQEYQVWLVADDDVDMFVKGKVDRALPESERRFKDQQIAWIDELSRQGRVEKQFNKTLFAAGDSREPELAGLRGAIVGSFYTLSVTLVLSFILGVATAIFLEEYAPRNNRWMDLIEVNINNLAAVPSIVFGLLGLAVFINFWGLPRSAPVVAGLVLTLMTLPTVTIASRAALKSVPVSVRQAALGIGASKTQTIVHHVLPLALPGMLTGTIIGMAQALGETAPLLMLGMVAFVVDIPASPWDPSTALPVQIFLWSDAPERAFAERTSAAIMVLLAFLIAMNFVAVLVRRRFENRW